MKVHFREQFGSKGKMGWRKSPESYFIASEKKFINYWKGDLNDGFSLFQAKSFCMWRPLIRTQ